MKAFKNPNVNDIRVYIQLSFELSFPLAALSELLTVIKFSQSHI